MNYRTLIETEVAKYNEGNDDFDFYYYVESLMNIIGWKRCIRRKASSVVEEKRIMEETHSECLSYSVEDLVLMARW